MFVIVGLIILGVIVYFVVSKDGRTTPVKTQTSESVVIESSTQGVIKMEAGSFYYTPNEIRVKKGDVVKIELTAKDMMHNFYLDEFGVKSKTVKEGETTTIEFVADKVGEFEFYCNVTSHRSKGQVGKLIVEE